MLRYGDNDPLLTEKKREKKKLVWLHTFVDLVMFTAVHVTVLSVMHIPYYHKN